jgi:DNA-binding MarR family transcriptional regulator
MAQECNNFILFVERISEIFRALLWEKAKDFQISPIQIQILMFLREKPPAKRNTTYLSQKLKVTPATVSESIGNLIEKKLVESRQCSDDRRKNCFTLTPKGRKITNQICNWHTALSDAFLNGMNKSEQDTFTLLAYKILYQASKDHLIIENEFCFDCKYFVQENENQFYCAHYNQKLTADQLRIQCSHFREKKIKYSTSASHSGK